MNGAICYCITIFSHSCILIAEHLNQGLRHRRRNLEDLLHAVAVAAEWFNFPTSTTAQVGLQLMQSPWH